MGCMRILVIAASSDIGAHLVEHYLKLGAEVTGTYRRVDDRISHLEQLGANMLPLEIDSADSVSAFVDQLARMEFCWDVLISAPGLLAPIGNFFDLDFDEWERSVMVNSTCQLRVLHAVHKLRASAAKVVFFAGGGTNSPFDNYSAYCIGKLSLIKMTELLDSECPDLQVSIIGTGWVNTKIHRQTMNAGAAAGANYERTKDYIEGGQALGVSLDDVAQCVHWCISSERDIVGGRNFSLVHDQWRNPEFKQSLKENPNTYKLRRLS